MSEGDLSSTNDMRINPVYCTGCGRSVRPVLAEQDGNLLLDRALACACTTHKESVDASLKMGSLPDLWEHT